MIGAGWLNQMKKGPLWLQKELVSMVATVETLTTVTMARDGKRQSMLLRLVARQKGLVLPSCEGGLAL